MMHGRVLHSWQLADVEEEVGADSQISGGATAAKPAWLVASLSLFFCGRLSIGSLISDSARFNAT